MTKGVKQKSEIWKNKTERKGYSTDELKWVALTIDSANR